MIDTWDNYECKGQMTLEDFLNIDIPECIFAVSDIFAAAKKQMNLSELKAFTYALTHIKFTGENGNKVMLDKKTLAAIVGIHCGADTTDLSQNLKRSIGQLPKHSFIEIDAKNLELYASGVVVTNLRFYKNNACITLNPEYMPLFSKLEKGYITMWSGDIFSMKSERSCTFYEYLRLHSDTRGMNSQGFGIKFFKELFGIPKDGKGSYMRQDGHFDRPAFERFVIDPLCEDLKHCKMINLAVQEDGKYYQKVKKNGRVLGYKFFWYVNNRPGIAPASEMQETQAAIAADPAVLKVANDLVHRKKSTKSGRKSTANSGIIHQDDYNDIAALERELLGGK